MVDRDRVDARLERLGLLLRALESTRAAGVDAYLADEQRRLATERALTVALQLCIDLAAQLVGERGGRTPDTYAGVFAALAADGTLAPELAERLGAAARQRNLLVHLYLEIDDRRVFAALEHLDDLRAFAVVVRAEG